MKKNDPALLERLCPRMLSRVHFIKTFKFRFVLIAGSVTPREEFRYVIQRHEFAGPLNVVTSVAESRVVLLHSFACKCFASCIFLHV